VSKYPLLIVLPLLACSSTPPPVDDSEGPGSSTSLSPPTTQDGPSTATMGPSTGAGSPNTTHATSSSSDEGPDETALPPIFDVGGNTWCTDHPSGIYCVENVAIECSNGDLIHETPCLPDPCLEGSGCVECLEGQYTCKADRVMECNTIIDPPHWSVLETCNPSFGEGCDLALADCVQLGPVGTNVPTGEYYQFSSFEMGASAFQAASTSTPSRTSSTCSTTPTPSMSTR
jgi:hypothetical protein